MVRTRWVEAVLSLRLGPAHHLGATCRSQRRLRNRCQGAGTMGFPAQLCLLFFFFLTVPTCSGRAQPAPRSQLLLFCFPCLSGHSFLTVPSARGPGRCLGSRGRACGNRSSSLCGLLGTPVGPPSSALLVCRGWPHPPPSGFAGPCVHTSEASLRPNL